MITNPYTPDPTSAHFNVKKELNCMNKGVEPQTFRFTLYDEKGEELETVSVKGAGTVSCDDGQVKTADNKADGSFAFEEFTFMEPGTYTITVSEDAGTLGRIIYDDSAYTVTVTVTENGKGELAADTDACAEYG